MEQQAFTLVTEVTKPAIKRFGGPKGDRKYPFGNMAVGVSFKFVFNSNDTEGREKEIRKIRAAVLVYTNDNEPKQFETWTVTEQQAIEVKDPIPGAGIWVRRVEDYSEAQLVKRDERRLEMHKARDKKNKAASAESAEIISAVITGDTEDDS